MFVPTVRMDAILMNLENIFLTKQREHFALLDRSIRQREREGSPEKPSIQNQQACLCTVSAGRDTQALRLCSIEINEKKEWPDWRDYKFADLKLLLYMATQRYH